MNYYRVIPRDLFNEGRLLTALGHLSIAIHDNREDIASVLKMEIKDSIHGFVVDQDESDGSIYPHNVSLTIKYNYEDVHLYLPCNTQHDNSLHFRYGNYEGIVFKNFEYSKEFASFLEYLHNLYD